MARVNVQETQELLQEAQKLISQQSAALEQTELQMEYLQENYTDAVRSMLAAEDVGWNLIGGRNQDALNMLQLRQISRQLREYSETNPLLSRGHEIRCSYLYGSSYTIVNRSDEQNIAPRHKIIFEDPLNQKAIFSVAALKRLERARYTDGNVFVAFNKKTKRFSAIPFTQISDAVYDPQNPSELWYIQRTFTEMIRPADGASVQITPVGSIVWYPIDTYKPESGSYEHELGGYPVDQDSIVIDDRVNLSVGNTWGTPDSFAAAPWALAYSSYLRDGTKVLSALAEYAWKISPKSKLGSTTAAAKMSDATGKAKTALTDMEMTSLPRANAVDLSTGRPLASQAAAALGVSVVLLLADPENGSYGTAQTLTDPTIKTMGFRQDEVGQFLRRCLTVAGMPEARVIWGKMATDAEFREAQILTMAWDTGLYHEDEIREALAAAHKIKLTHKKAPKKVLIPNNAKSDAAIDEQIQLSKILAKAQATGEAPAASSTISGTRITKTKTSPAAAASKVTGQGRGGKTSGSVSAGVNDLKAGDKANSSGTA